LTFERFEDVLVWQTARNLARVIYRTSAKGQFAKDIALRNQIRPAAVSMMANIAEGLARRSDKEFTHYLFTAKGSVAEVESHLYVVLDQGYIDEDDFRQMFDLSELYARQVSGLISFLTNRPKRSRSPEAENIIGSLKP